MQKYRKLTTVCCAAVLALGLAACGGGGGGDDTAEGPTMTGPTQAELDAAQKAAEEAAAQAAAEQAAKEAAEQELADKEAADTAAASTLMGKQLHRAMGATPLANLGTRPADATATPPVARRHLASLSPSGVTVWLPDLTTPATPTATASPLMKASGDALDALNGWEGQHYFHTLSGTSNEARVYSFKAGPPGKTAAEAFSDDTGTVTFVSRQETAASGAYDAEQRLVAFGDTTGDDTADPASTRFKSDHFPTAGETSYEADDTGTISFEGTYDGVPGIYRCTPGGSPATCSAEKIATNVVLTAGTWTFVHEVGAMTSVPDTAYQFFGWWLTKTDGAPTRGGASAFFGTAGTGGQATVDLAAISGTATYSGSAAGKWAHDDPITDTGGAGHFTADVALTAKFGDVTDAGNESGVTGSLTNFMANEEPVDWTVTLTRAGWSDADTADVAVTQTADTNTLGAFGGGRTVWTIDGKRADPSGSWNGVMYDDAGGDNSNVPTAAAGVFHSEAGSAWRMVGGFGVRKD